MPHISQTINVYSSQLSFPKLSTEIVQGIATLLQDGQDVLSLRLTCRDLYRKTFDAFAEAFFRTIETDLSLQDMGRLEALAKHEGLCRHVRELCLTIKKRTLEILGPEHRDSGISRWFRKVYGFGYHWPRTSHGALRDDVPLVQDMCELLRSRFPRCTAFRVCRGETDFEDEACSEEYLTSADAMVLLLRIIALAGVKISFFDAFPGVKYGVVGLQRVRLSHSFWDFDYFDTIWAHSLQELNLNYCDGWDESRPSSCTIRLLSTTKALRTLRYKVSGGEHSGAILEEVTRNFSSPLEILIMHWTHVSARVLLDFMLLVRDTLTTVVFDNVYLKHGHWQEVLEGLRDHFPLLVSVTMFSVAPPSHAGTRLLFCPLRSKSNLPAPFGHDSFKLADVGMWRRLGTAGVGYKGENMAVALDVLIRHMYILVGSIGSPNNRGRIVRERSSECTDFSPKEWCW